MYIESSHLLGVGRLCYRLFFFGGGGVKVEASRCYVIILNTILGWRSLFQDSLFGLQTLL